MNSRLKTVAILFVLAATAGCGGAARTPPPGRPPTFTPPAWVDKPIKGCAVGSARDRGLKRLARKAAVAHARDELARQMRVFVQSMMKDYQRSHHDGKGKPLEEQNVVSVSRGIVDQVMAGTRTVKVEAAGPTVYALACLDPRTFASSIGRMKKLDDRIKRAMKRRAAEEFRNTAKRIDRVTGRKVGKKKPTAR